MINKDDYSMKKEWTRDDLPHQHEVWDDFVAGKHSDVFHAVNADDLGEVLDEIINHLNAHHPKPQTYDCGETIDALNRNRDALVENREQSIFSLQRLLADTESDVETELDQENQKLHSEWMIEHIRANAAEDRVRQLEDYIRGVK